MSNNYDIEYDMRDYIDLMMCDMLKHDESVPDIRRWEQRLTYHYALGLSFDEVMEEIRREFFTLSIEQRHWCRAYGELMSFSHALGKYGHNWWSVAEVLQPDDKQYRQSEARQFVNLVL